MHVSLSEYHALGDAIIALNTPAFTSRYVALLREIVDFDCAVMLGYRHNKHPIYLYDSIPDNRELLFQRYLTESYQHDPFYRLVADTQQEGVFHLSEMTDAPHSYQQSHYQQQFYPQTGWQDEMSLAVQLDHERWILLYLGHLAAGRR
ncbi:MAG: LuxR family transcriptional regulator, partial [Vibrio fluvialis]